MLFRSGFGEWLLRQRDVEIHDATIVWSDEQRKAPPLELKNVSLQLFSHGGRHRFGVQATPPRELAAPLDVRGDITGESLKSFSDWNGELFLQLEGIEHRKTRVKRPQSTDVIDKGFLCGSALRCCRAWVTALSRRLHRRSSSAAPVRAFLGPRGFQPATKRV